MAERVGFEPTVRFPVRSLSRRVLSTAQSPLRGHCKFNRSKCCGFIQSTVSSADILKLFIDSMRAECDFCYFAGELTTIRTC